VGLGMGGLADKGLGLKLIKNNFQPPNLEPNPQKTEDKPYYSLINKKWATIRIS